MLWLIKYFSIKQKCKLLQTKLDHLKKCNNVLSFSDSFKKIVFTQYITWILCFVIHIYYFKLQHVIN